MKQTYILLFILLSAVGLRAQTHYQFRTNTPQGFSVEQSTATSLSLHYAIDEICITDIDNGEARGHEIALKGSFGSFAEGQPNLPVESRYIAVPRGATVSISVKENASMTLDDIDILPAARVQTDVESGLPKLSKDKSIYSKNANFPNENVVIAQSTRIRGLDVALLSVTPFRYNPVRRSLEVIYDMDIEIRFEGGDGQFGEERYRNPDWDHILRELVVNGDMLPEAHYYERLNQAIQNREDGCEYLIIAPDDDSILAWADSLKHFRTRQGILTKVVTTTDCGGNEPERIKGYIKNAYENWAIPPAALMIFNGYHDTIYGDEIHYLEGIPGFPLLFKNYENGHGQVYDEDYISDNPYADMNDDTIPDIAISRLSALKPDEYKTQFEKLFEYETNPPTNPHYYDHPVITSSYAKNTWFMLTSQAVNGFFSNKLGLHPSNFYMPYEHDTEPNTPDSAWSTGYNTSAPFEYFGPDGQNYFPRYLFELDDWRDMFENQYLIDAMSEESFLTLYRDHSGSDAWCSPFFYSSEIKKLRNELPTFLLSIGCDAAQYQQNYYDTEAPLIHAFCNTPVGALGGIGAVTLTRSQFNDIFTWGLMDYFWPDFMPTLGNSTSAGFARPVFAMVAGKLFLNQHVFMPGWWPGYIYDTDNVIHYLGETYLSLCTEVPHPMDFTAAAYQPNNDLNYRFRAEEGAVVCLSNDAGIIAVATATGQDQSISLPQMAVGERFIVTATKQNRYRLEQGVEVFDAANSFVYIKSLTLDDEDGNGQLDYGEIINFDLGLHNYNSVASEGAEIVLECNSPYVEITNGRVRYPQMASNATVDLEHAFTIKLSNDVPDQTELRFDLRFNDGSNQHRDRFSFMANAPIISLEPDYSISDEQGEPSTHIKAEGKSFITFNISNAGHSDSQLVSAELDLKAPFVGMENHVAKAKQIGRGQTETFVFEMDSDGSDLRPGWINAKLKVQDREFINEKDTLVQYSAFYENFETDTLNPDCQWANSGLHWTYCDDDAWEGNRCFIANSADGMNSTLRARVRETLANHNNKLSFRYKVGNNEVLEILGGGGITANLEADDWKYQEIVFQGGSSMTTFRYTRSDSLSPQAKIDNLCFPPAHRAIAFAGHDMTTCDGTAVELSEAYAYDCDSTLWITNGDGHFEEENLVNTIYYPGSQDIANSEVAIQLLAFSGTDTIATETRIRFVDDIELGAIVGDTVVNKYEQPVSNYSIDNQDGINYKWQLEPAWAGIVYAHGNEADIVWNLHEGDAEVTLSVTADNGCDTEPVGKHIQLIGYSTPEWTTPNFDLFPNPTDGTVHFVIGETLHGKTVIEVYNLLGERMMQRQAGQLHKGQTFTLDLSPLPSGLYILMLNSENGSCSKKVSIR